MTLETEQDMEQIENQLEELKIIQDNGFMNLSHYQQFKNEVATGLRVFGDSFTTRLGEALRHASLRDSLKIMRYWQAEAYQCASLYRIQMAKQKALSSQPQVEEQKEHECI